MSSADFSPGEAMISEGAVMLQVTQREMRAVSVQVPRDLKKVRDAVLDELKHAPEMASRGFFNKPAGNQTITGPSIHLARMVARNFTNCSVRSYLAGVDSTGVYQIGGVWIDLESNIVFDRLMPVSTSSFRKGQNGNAGYYETLKGEKLTQALLVGCSKAERNVISAGVPDWIMQQAFNGCRQIVAKTGRDQLGDMIEHCEKKGVERAALERHLGVEALNSDLTDDQIFMLKGIANGLTSGDVKVEEVGVIAEAKAEPKSTSIDDVLGATAVVTSGDAKTESETQLPLGAASENDSNTQASAADVADSEEDPGF